MRCSQPLALAAVAGGGCRRERRHEGRRGSMRGRSAHPRGRAVGAWEEVRVEVKRGSDDIGSIADLLRVDALWVRVVHDVGKVDLQGGGFRMKKAGGFLLRQWCHMPYKVHMPHEGHALRIAVPAR